MKNPDRKALVFKNKILTYRELDKSSNLVSDILIEKGSGSGSIVGLITERSIEMIIGIFGILKSGAAYLPINPNYPKERINHILKNSGTKNIVTQKKYQHQTNTPFTYIELKSIPIGHKKYIPKKNKAKAKELAYIIYTSGSTGNPKGVMIEHHSVVNRLNWMQLQYPLSSRDRILQKTTYTFDVSVWEIFWWSQVGASLFLLPPGEEKDPVRLKRFIEQQCITTIHFVPSMLNAFLEVLGHDQNFHGFKSLRKVFSSGEALQPTQVLLFNRLFNRQIVTKLINLYGPTEATVDVSFFDCDQEGADIRVPIGKPIDNTRFYILDKNLSIQPIGVAGELCISGVNLARGYINNIALTVEKFIPNPYLPGDYLYKTGDLARWLPQGDVEYMGRMDFQVKIRGFRIELGEIEYHLLRLQEIKEAVVLCHTHNGSNTLCAYIVLTSDAKSDEKAIRQYLGEQLPDYMIPAYILFLEKLPLTPNGKLDRRSLPGPKSRLTGSLSDYQVPRDKIEQTVSRIWEDVLGIRPIGVNDNFFMIGGDSIKTIQVSSRLVSAGYHVSVQEIFKYPTIRGLSARVRQGVKIPDQSVVQGEIPLTPIQKRFFEEVKRNRHHYNQAVILRIDEYPEKRLIENIFKKIQDHHDALRTTFKEAGGEIIQENQGLDHPLAVSFFDYRGEEEAIAKFELERDKIQASINLEDGPLMKIGLFYMEDSSRLLIAVHHLVIDGVSWRILFEDLERLYQQHKKGERLTLPHKSGSYKQWAKGLLKYSSGGTLSEEKAYWESLLKTPVEKLEADNPQGDNYVKDLENVSFRLSKNETTLLKTRANNSFHTQINDLLLLGLGLAIKTVFGKEKILIDLESHGREDIIEGVNITRTLGWFTGIYPVLLDTSGTTKLNVLLKHNKELLHGVPRKGIGYGILRYMSKHWSDNQESKNKREICFNYLGDFGDGKQEEGMQVAPESPGQLVGENVQREYELEVVGMISQGRLEIRIGYSRNRYLGEKIKQLSRQYKESLSGLISFCCSHELEEYTPSDLTYKGLTLTELDRLQGIYKIKDIYTLSPLQDGILFHSVSEEGSRSYFQQVSYRISGELDISLVKKSFQHIVSRYDILRTLFLYAGYKQALQVVLNEREIEFAYSDIRKEGTQKNREQTVRDYKEYDKNRGFDLTNDALIRVHIFRVDEGEYEFLWSYHHIVMDGWCIGIIITELVAIYQSMLQGADLQLPPVTQYRHYIEWIGGIDKKASLNYWQSYLKGYEERATLPCLSTILPGDTYQLAHHRINLEQGTSRKIREVCGKLQVTVNTFMQGVWGVVLGRYNSCDDVVFGQVVSGRPAEIEGIEEMLGLFINTIPVRVKYTTSTSFQNLLESLQDGLIESTPYHYISLSDIQAKSYLKQELFDHILVFENYPVSEQVSKVQLQEDTNLQSKIQTHAVELFEQTNYNFNIIVLPGDRITIEFSYNSNLYSPEIVKQTARHFKQVTKEVLKNIQQPVNEIAILTENEKEQLLYTFNNTSANYPKDKTIIDLFEEQVMKNPDSICISYNNLQITYKELNDRSNYLATILISRGVSTQTIVGLMLGQTPDMVIGIMSVLKSGGSYLPIDTTYPKQRINYILNDSNTQYLITQNETNDHIKTISNTFTFSNIDFNSRKPSKLVIKNKPGHVAYIIYTSGTTGNPKGALIEHKNVVRLLFNSKVPFEFSKKDIWSLFHSFCFDFSVWEMYGALLNGARVIIVPQFIAKNTEQFLLVLKLQQVTVLNQTPSAFYNLLTYKHEYEKLNLKIRYIIFGGEALNPSKLKHWRERYPGTRLINMFGITETTVHVTFKEIRKKNIDLTTSNIGKPIPTTTTYILNTNHQLCPVGIPGELCVGGDGVGKGYLNIPGLTHEKFVKIPDLNDERIYLSGDLAKHQNSGDLEYLGRIDKQVQIRGYRIEVKEIETHLLKHKTIKNVIVVDLTDDDDHKYLCAYYLANNPIDSEKIRDFLMQRLPAYMIPSYFVNISNIPLTPNGKIDLKSLPDPRRLKSLQNTEYETPRNAIEKILVEIWKEVLNRDEIGINDNLFVIGGDSIKTIQISSRLSFHGYHLSVKDILQNPTIKQLALKARKKERVSDQSVVTGEIDLTPIQKRFFNTITIKKHHYNQAVLLKADEYLDLKAIEKIFRKLQEHHDALRMTFIQEKNKIVQQNHGLDYPLSASFHDLRGNENSEIVFEKKKEFLQENISLQEGPLMKTALFYLDDGSRLLIIIHHLVVDGVSWRILFEDLGQLYSQWKKKENFKLPQKTDSFKYWSQKLNEYANSSHILNELKYWKTINDKGSNDIEPDFKDVINKVSDAESKWIRLNRQETKILLTKANNAFNTQINDILLLALGLGIKDVFGINKLRIDMEGHGREEIIEDLNITRTIGWFTSIFPVIIDTSGNVELKELIKRNKEILRSIPNKGIGYGILKYLSKEKHEYFSQDSKICFNYLGEFGTGGDKQNNHFGFAPESTGPLLSKEGIRDYELEINGLIVNKCLEIRITYCKNQYKAITIEKLKKQY